MILLIQLYQLNISTEYCYFNSLIKLLQFTHNLWILSLDSILISTININNLENNQTFQLMLHRNKMERLHIINGCILNIVKLFTHLCTKLKYLTIDKLLDAYEPMIQFLLLKTILNYLYNNTFWN